MPELKVLNRGIRPNDPSRPKISIAGSNLFTKLHKSDPELIHEVTIAVNQRNLDLIHDILMERSQPGHTNYQKWLSFSEIHSLIRNDEAVKAIRSWVKEAGGKIISVTPHGDYIRAAASICTWERALDAKFYCWEHIKTSTSSSLSTTSSSSSMRSRIYHRAESYSIPAHMQAHISAIFRTSQAPVIPRRHGQKRPYQATPAAGADANMPRNRSSAFPYGLTGDSRPSSLNLMYGITSNTASAALSQAVFETSSELMSQADLKKFQQYFSLPQQAAVLFNSTSSSSCDSNTCGEGNLDIQYIMGIAQQAKGIFWYSNGTNIGTATDDPFVDSLVRIAGEVDPPTVFSISWGSDEQLNSPDYTTAFNNEAMKLGLRGVTIFVSSGDNGVSGDYCSCNVNSASNTDGVYWQGSNSWTGKGYFPSYPATSPFVVAVGATMGPQNGGVEISCQSQLGGVITSGGGFSTVFSQPTWQASAVNSFLQRTTATAGYNPAGRAMPDLSFVGVKYPSVIGGSLYNMYGTSASTPLFAAMITLVNSQRRANGLGPVGFINPTLYANANKFHDVTSGHNKCCVNGGSGSATCCSAGFTAGPGWDPVTGLGSISFTNLTAIFVTSAPTPQPTTSPSVESSVQFVSLRPSQPSTDPTLSPTNPPFKCPSFSTSGSKTVPCLFRACAGETLLISSSPSDGGTCSGPRPTLSYLYDSTGLEVISSTSFMYNLAYPSCSYTQYTVPAQSPSCQVYTLQQGCIDSGSCAGQYVIRGGGTYIVSLTPTNRPTSIPTGTYSPTMLPTLRPTLPTSVPSSAPSTIPTTQPTCRPSTVVPTAAPSTTPSVRPTVPTLLPSFVPTGRPTSRPTTTLTPSRVPSLLPLSSSPPSLAPGPIITTSSSLASGDSSFMGSTEGVAVVSAGGAVALVLLLLLVVCCRRKYLLRSGENLIALDKDGKAIPAGSPSRVSSGMRLNPKATAYSMQGEML